MPANHPAVTTVDALLALPDDGLRHELLDGEHVVTPAPNPKHQFVLQDIFEALRKATADRDDLRVVLSPADIVLSPSTLVQPDLFVIGKIPGEILSDWSEVGVPILALEVLSPSTASRDRGSKRRIYQRAGIAEYWIVDLDARIVERWTPESDKPEIIDGPLVWDPPRGPRVTVDTIDIFHRNLGAP